MAVFLSCTKQIKDLKSTEDVDTFIKNNESILLETSNCEKEWKAVEDFLISCITCGHINLVKVASKILKKKNIIKWKSHSEVFPKLMQTITTCGQEPVQSSNMYSENDFVEFFECLLALMKGNQALKHNNPALIKLLTAAVSSRENRLLKLPQHYTENIPWQQKTEFSNALEVMQISHDVLKVNPEMSSKDDYSCLIINTWRDFLHSFHNNIKAAKGCAKVAGKMYMLCAKANWYIDDNEEVPTLERELLLLLTQDYYADHAQNGKDILKIIFPKLLVLWETTDEEIKENTTAVINCMKGNDAAELGKEKFVEAIIKRYISEEDTVCVANFQEMYPKARPIFHKYLDEISAAMDRCDSWTDSMVMMFLFRVAEHDGSVVSTKVINDLMTKLEGDNSCQVLQIIKPIVDKVPEKIRPFDDKIIEAMNNKLADSALGAEILQIIVDSQENAVKYIEVMKTLIPKCDYVRQIHHVINMHKIGEKYPRALKPHEKYLRTLLKNKDLQSFVQQALNFLAGISLASVSKAAESVKKDATLLDKKAHRNEEKTKSVHQKVDATQKKLSRAQNDVKMQSHKQTKVKGDVEETAKKITQIDKKMVSRCPIWCEDIAKLPSLSSDWKQLATRLGYVQSEISKWSKEKNPISSLLADWFSKKRTAKDTQLILKTLQDLKKVDACLLVENALKAGESLVSDEEFQHLSSPPIFISYHWSVQTEAKTLQKHLQMAGYESWLDVGQMGGGNKLLANIDKGIRESKVVLSCISQKYPQSPNANREVNLAINIKKPIIPLLMEKMNWPPPGTMGPIFGEYIYIRFYTSSKENIAGENVWPQEKFQELLFQVKKHSEPDKNSVNKIYKNWWHNPIILEVGNNSNDVSEKDKTTTKSLHVDSSKAASVKAAQSSMSTAASTNIVKSSIQKRKTLVRSGKSENTTTSTTKASGPTTTTPVSSSNNMKPKTSQSKTRVTKNALK